jgi:hypothetical protein
MFREIVGEQAARTVRIDGLLDTARRNTTRKGGIPSGSLEAKMVTKF